MARTDRRSARDLIAEIRATAPRFRFFQAVRLLALSTEEKSMPPSLRFGAPLSLGFPASEILHAESDVCDEGMDEGNAALRLAIGFMGMTGPSGVLPSAYTEALIERRNFHRDTAAHSFLDMFTHRSVSLFYAAWRKNRFHISYEAGDREGFTRNMLDLVGAGLKSMQPAQQGKGGMPLMLLNHFTGLLSQRPVSATNLAALCRGYFGVEVQVEQFVGQWGVVPTGEQTRLGAGNCTLGETAAAGQRLWDRQNKIRLRIGPIDATQFADFLPGQPGAAALVQLVAFCIGQQLACDVALVLNKEHMPRAILAGSTGAHLRLGHNTWLHGGVPQTHLDDARFTILN